MVVKIINGMRIHEPPHTQAEEDEFYRRVGGGPVTVARGAGEPKSAEVPSTAASVLCRHVAINGRAGIELVPLTSCKTSLGGTQARN
jgi:hypothetical protein